MRAGSLVFWRQEVVPPVPVIKLRKTKRLHSLITGREKPEHANLPHGGSCSDSSTSCFSAPGFVLRRSLGRSSPRWGASDAGRAETCPRRRAAGQSRTVPWVGCCWDVLPIKTRRPWHASSSYYLFKSVTGEQNPPMWPPKGEGDSNRTSTTITIAGTQTPI